ncbi:uncharacterized protein [Physcomitrium patens]|uniref:Uncharacterized protein n=1 Tax=Physcomitrium patens TaxID=3218 RepID=A0A2K1KJK9_PHYPA|nr:uncharacterized protein LOC112282627 [Physcomitrium patens]PNR53943.1 hypothetical protein PHYPA_007618 [Physcomitrium patens]|eukprot:XP_024376270.1 uncharacterized protein LOC112282627 [Physcomitrella patens]
MATFACSIAAFVPAASSSYHAHYNDGNHRSGHFLAMSRKGTRVQSQSLSSTLRINTVRIVILTCNAALPESDQPPKDLQVPRDWTSPSVAAQEAEWLRGALHQWLDDEYCPEPANEEISKRCSTAYLRCLTEGQVDMGEILMQMVRALESFSFKESFHGVFSSANAAIDLITKRMNDAHDS